MQCHTLSCVFASPPQLQKSGLWTACFILDPLPDEIKWRQERKRERHPRGCEPYHKIWRREGVVIRALCRLRGTDPAQRYCHHDDQTRYNLLPRRELEGSTLSSPFARSPLFCVTFWLLLYISFHSRTTLACRNV